MLIKKSILISPSTIRNNIRLFTSKKCVVNKFEKKNYVASYFTNLVFSDGSSIRVRCFEPRSVIKMPLTIDGLDEKEKKQWLIRRRIKEASKKEEDKSDVQFDKKDYLSYF